jgi:hypothetical protein
VLSRKDFVQSAYAHCAEWAEVRRIADELESFLNSAPVARRITEKNQPGVASTEIEKIITEKALPLGFQQGQQNLFEHVPNRNLRPDFYIPIGESGILLEVERGKTIQNNMDLLDFWKCHIAERAHYLILIVPQHLQQSSSSKPSKPFQAVVQRLEAFFMEQNYTNVRGAVVLGY